MVSTLALCTFKLDRSLALITKLNVRGRNKQKECARSGIRASFNTGFPRSGLDHKTRAFSHPLYVYYN